MREMGIVTAIVSAIVFTFITLADSAPQQAVIVAAACYLAIIARIFQASGHNRSNKKNVGPN